MAGSIPRLIVRDAFGNERNVEITRTPFSLGRQSDNDLVLLDNRISRRHAVIVKDGDGYAIRDAGSRHGTFVNGDPVKEKPLQDGDQIRLGVADSYQLAFAIEQADLPNLLERIGKVPESPAPQLHHLNLLLQMAQMLVRLPALEEVLTALLDSAIQLADAERALLFLRDDSGEFRLRLARGRGGTTLGTELTDYSRAAVERVAQSGREEVALEEEGTGRATHETGIIRGLMRGVVAVPLQKVSMKERTLDTTMISAPELLGVLYLDSRVRAASLTGLDRQVLQTLAVEGATVIENARLLRLTQEQERLQHELDLARNIQQGLLPRQLPRSAYFEMSALSLPCHTVGGDYYDVVTLPGDRFGFTVADVSGKGLPAAMLAATLQGAFASAAAGDPCLPDLFSRVNDFLCGRAPSAMYATIFYGVLDPTGCLNFVNAGHLPPLLLRSHGIVERLETPNFPLGLFAGSSFEVGRRQLKAGDQIMIFSDGVTEARDMAGDFYEETRLTSSFIVSGSAPAQEVCARVLADVRAFTGTAPQADDITLMILRFGLA
jgi:sigma-B regulation protein RsbU (phosphoserine phosphatase)